MTHNAQLIICFRNKLFYFIHFYTKLTLILLEFTVLKDLLSYENHKYKTETKNKKLLQIGN